MSCTDMSVPKTDATGVSVGSTEFVVAVGAVTTIVDMVPVTCAFAAALEGVAVPVSAAGVGVVAVPVGTEAVGDEVAVGGAAGAGVGAADAALVDCP